MSRTADVQHLYAPSAARSASGTTTTYFPIPTDILVKAVTVLGVNPGAADGDTLRVDVDYSPADAVSSYTTIADTTADEYNDTDDTASLGAVAATADIRTVGAADWSTTGLTFPGTRVAGNTFIRVREIWTGTVTDGQVVIGVHFVNLNDTIDAS